MSIDKVNVAVLGTLMTSARAECLSVVHYFLKVAKQPLRYRDGHADGFWEVEVLPDGRVVPGGYALELGLPETLDELPLTELARLAEEADASIKKLVK